MTMTRRSIRVAVAWCWGLTARPSCGLSLAERCGIPAARRFYDKECPSGIPGSFFSMPAPPADVQKKDPLLSEFALQLSLFSGGPVGLYETPIQARGSYYPAAAAWNCICAFAGDDCAAHWPGHFLPTDMPTDMPADGPAVPPAQSRAYLVAHPDERSTDARALCGTFALAALRPLMAVPRDRELEQEAILRSLPAATVGLHGQDTRLHPALLDILQDAVAKVDRDRFEPPAEPAAEPNTHSETNYQSPILEYVHERLVQFAECKSYSPQALGQIIALQLFLLSRLDGWNADGLIRHLDPGLTKCTANCVPYADYTNFQNFPQLNPANNANNVNNTEYPWEPMLETDHRGLLSRTLFTVPQIGHHAMPATMTRSKMTSLLAPPPNYNYTQETALLLQRMSNLTDDKLDQIGFMDRKAYMVAEIMMALPSRSQSQNIAVTYEQILWFWLGVSSSLYDSVIAVWKEKLRYNLIRPTTYIQKYMPNDDVPLWSSPSQTIKGRDFQATIRVMPHSEYPSGSACICQAVGDFTTRALAILLADDNTAADPLHDSISPQEMEIHWTQHVPPRDRTPYSPEILTRGHYPTIASMVEACGISRLDAGLHFTASVPNGRDLCRSIGPDSITNMMKHLLYKQDMIDSNQITSQNNTGNETQSENKETVTTIQQARTTNNDNSLYPWPNTLMGTPRTCTIEDRITVNSSNGATAVVVAHNSLQLITPLAILLFITPFI